jgi:hypothetical protein
MVVKRSVQLPDRLQERVPAKLKKHNRLDR